MNFCKYKNSLGVPNIGMHKYYYSIAILLLYHNNHNYDIIYFA